MFIRWTLKPVYKNLKSAYNFHVKNNNLLLNQFDWPQLLSCMLLWNNMTTMKFYYINAHLLFILANHNNIRISIWSFLSSSTISSSSSFSFILFYGLEEFFSLHNSKTFCSFKVFTISSERDSGDLVFPSSTSCLICASSLWNA